MKVIDWKSQLHTIRTIAAATYICLYFIMQNFGSLYHYQIGLLTGSKSMHLRFICTIHYQILCWREVRRFAARVSAWIENKNINYLKLIL